MTPIPTKISAVVLLTVLACLLLSVSSVDAYATCKGCHCVPFEGEDCPVDDIPPTTFSPSLISNYKKLALANTIELSCDPFSDSTCETSPLLEEGGACVVEYDLDDSPTESTLETASYTLKTVASRRQAEQNLQIVTHQGPCGLCSSLQDLTVYMDSDDLTASASSCGFKAIRNVTDGIACFEEVGFTRPCATIWAYNTRQTSTACPMCVGHVLSDLPNNDQETCALVPCIQCDEDESGPIFGRFAGRTRRNTGILTQIVRPCDAVVHIHHRDPLENSPLTLLPTTSSTPTMSPTSRASNYRIGTFATLIIFVSTLCIL